MPGSVGMGSAHNAVTEMHFYVRGSAELDKAFLYLLLGEEKGILCCSFFKNSL